MTQISSKGEWLRISRADFIDRFLFMPNYREIINEAVQRKIAQYTRIMQTKEKVSDEILKAKSDQLLMNT